MKQIAELVNNPIDVKRPMGADQLTKSQAEAVGYFFVRLKMLDPIQYDTLMPDDKTERLIKREYAAYLKDLTRDKIDVGFAAVHELRQGGDPNHRFLNIDRVVGVICGSSSSRAGIYRRFETKALPDKAAQERAEKAGSRELEKLKGMFNE